jgi:drug/metabolite transporter (DMT)-like permease
MTKMTPRQLFLLALMTLFWGVNWPVMKFAVHTLPPLTFRGLGMSGGLVCLWAWARYRGIDLNIPQSKAGTILKLAIPNMVAWHLVAIIAIASLPSGRAAILGYTMPVWAVLSGWALYGDRPRGRQWISIACAATAIALLLSSELVALAGAPAGTLMMLFAAANWGLGTVMLRRAHLIMDTVALTFWMLLVATVAVCVGAVAFEASRWHAPTLVEWTTIAYQSAIVFGFCHVVWFSLARALPPIASGLSTMMIPVVGTISGVLALGEKPHAADYAAMFLVLGALATTIDLRRSASKS